jgi:hypothetical protein
MICLKCDYNNLDTSAICKLCSAPLKEVASQELINSLSNKLIQNACQAPGQWIAEILGNYSSSEDVPNQAIKRLWEVDENGQLTGWYRTNPNFNSSHRKNCNPTAIDYQVPKIKRITEYSIDIEKTAKTLDYYLNGKSSFIILKYGTLIGIYDHQNPIDAQRIVAERFQSLFQKDVGFNPFPMDDSNWLVEYLHPNQPNHKYNVVSIIFHEEVLRYKQEIDHSYLNYIAGDELFLDKDGQPKPFDERGKVGLFARARLFMDARDPKIIKIWNPQTKNL